MDLLNEIKKNVTKKLSKDMQQLDNMLKSHNKDISRQAHIYITKIVKSTAKPYLEELSKEKYDVLCKEIDFEKKSTEKMMLNTLEDKSFVYTFCVVSNIIYDYCKSYKNEIKDESVL